MELDCNSEHLVSLPRGTYKPKVMLALCAATEIHGKILTDLDWKNKTSIWGCGLIGPNPEKHLGMFV